MQDFMQYVYTVLENYFHAMSVLSFGLDLGPVGCEEKGDRGGKDCPQRHTLSEASENLFFTPMKVI